MRLDADGENAEVGCRLKMSLLIDCSAYDVVAAMDHSLCVWVSDLGCCAAMKSAMDDHCPPQCIRNVPAV